MTVSASLWLGLFPLLQFGSYQHITMDKWILMLILTGVTLIAFLLDGLRGRLRIPARIPALLGGFLLLWTVISCLLSPYGSSVWWIGGSVRREGLATQLCYVALFFLFLCSRVRLRPVLYAAAAGLTVFLAVVLLQRAGGNPLGLYPPGRSYARNPEFQGTIGNIDMGAGYLCLLAGLFLPVLLHRFRRSPHPSGDTQKFLAEPSSPRGMDLTVAVAGFVLCVYLIVTIEVQFGLIALGAVVLFCVMRALPRWSRLPLLICLILAGLALAWFWPGEGGGLWELHEILHGRTQLSFGSNRVAVWLYSLRMAPQRLMSGGGADTFMQRFNTFLTESGLQIPASQGDKALPHYFDNPHNEYLAVLLNQGLPSLVAFLGLILHGIFQQKKRLRQTAPDIPADLRCAVLAYAVQAFFSFSVCIVAPLFWIVLALSFSETPPSSASPR